MKSIENAVFSQRCQALIIAACSLIVPTAHAQLNYLSASRSVTANARVDPSGYSRAPYNLISYSGDFVGSNAPVSPFADFSTTCAGTATLVYNTTPNGGGPYTVTSSTSADQNSFFHPQEIAFNGGAAIWGSPSTSGGMPYGAWGVAESRLSVTFTVSAPVSYSLMCEGLGDPVAAGDSYTLTSANQGTLASTAPLFGDRYFGAPIYYNGTFNPGDVYTLSLDTQVYPDAGGLKVDLVVPEPSSTILIGLGVACAAYSRRGKRGLALRAR